MKVKQVKVERKCAPRDVTIATTPNEKIISRQSVKLNPREISHRKERSDLSLSSLIIVAGVIAAEMGAPGLRNYLASCKV